MEREPRGKAYSGASASMGRATMVKIPRRTIATLTIASLVLVSCASTCHAGWISTLDSASVSQILFGDDFDATLGQNGAGSMCGASQAPAEHSDSKAPWPWHLSPTLVEVAAMQAGQSAGMSGTSLSITGSSSSNSQAALIGPPLDLSDPPLRDRVLDEPKLILPSGRVFELLRPA